MTAAMWIKGGERAATFEQVARALVAHRGDLVEALRSVEGDRSASPRVVDIIRAGVSAGGIGGGGGWGTQIEWSDAVAGYIESLQPVSVASRLLASGMRRSPLGKRLLTVELVGVARTVARGAPKPVIEMAGGQVDVPLGKSAAIVLVSAELARMSGEQGMAAMSAALRRGVGTALDSGFLAQALDGADTAAASGATLADLQADARAAMAAALTEGSRPLWISAPDVGVALATMLTTGGDAAFPGMTPTGGQLFGVPLMVSSSMLDGTLALVDGASLSGDVTDIAIDASTQAVLDMSDDPAAPDADTVATSLWQMNLQAVRAEATFGVVPHRPAGRFVITGAAYA